jgi:hypothetical protein
MAGQQQRFIITANAYCHNFCFTLTNSFLALGNELKYFRGKTISGFWTRPAAYGHGLQPTDTACSLRPRPAAYGHGLQPTDTACSLRPRPADLLQPTDTACSLRTRPSAYGHGLQPTETACSLWTRPADLLQSTDSYFTTMKYWIIINRNSNKGNFCRKLSLYTKFA